MLPCGSHLTFEDVNRARLEPLRRPDPTSSLRTTETHSRWGQERNADDDTKLACPYASRSQPRRIFVNSALLELVDLSTRKFSHFVPQVGNKSRKSIRNLHGTSRVIVSKPKGGDAAIA